jgi:uncharacterized protein
MAWVAGNDAKGGPYRPCPCGSGEKFRFCHGDKSPASPFSGVDDNRIAQHGGGDSGTG